MVLRTLYRTYIKRGGAAGIISLFGVIFLIPTADYLLGVPTSTAGLVVAVLGAGISLVLIVAGGLLLAKEVKTNHILRVSGWAILGTVLLGFILVLIVRSGVELPLYAGAALLSVSTFAHVLIGVRDIQRIRARELARQREKLAVLNRLVRHNLRHEAQLLIGSASKLRNDAGSGQSSIADDTESVANRLTEMNEILKRTIGLMQQDRGDFAEIDLNDVVERTVETYRESYPDASIETDLPRDCRVIGGDEVETAVREVIENAIVHTGDQPHVTVTGRITGGKVVLVVNDDGPGIPESEKDIVMREVSIDQLTHSQGIGLWFVRWVMDAYDGRFDIESSSEGTTVILELPRA